MEMIRRLREVRRCLWGGRRWQAVWVAAQMSCGTEPNRGTSAMVPVQMEKFRMFRSIFWVSVRDSYEIAGSTARKCMVEMYGGNDSALF